MFNSLRQKWKGRRGGGSKTNDPFTSSAVGNPAAQSRPASVAPSPSTTPIPVEAESDGDEYILMQYTWASYKVQTPAVQRMVESAVLKAVVQQSIKEQGRASFITDNVFLTLLRDNEQLRAILLQCWEIGNFNHLRDSEAFHTLTQSDPRRQNSRGEDVPMLRLTMRHARTEHIHAQSPPPNPGVVNDQRGGTKDRDIYTEDTGVNGLRGELEYSKPEAADGAARSWEENAQFSPRRKQSMLSPLAGEKYEEILNSFNDNSCYIHDSFNNDYFIQLQIFKNHEAKIPEWLSLTEYSGTHNDIRRKRTDNTGTWFIQSQPFRDLCSNPYRRILWCPGIPGVGKTVIASLAIDHLRAQRPDSEQTAVVFIYFNYKLQNQQSLTTSVQSLSRQLHEICRATQSPSAFKTLYVSHMKHKSRPSVDELQHAFSETSQQFKHVFVVLDALDEYLERYSDHEIRQLVDTVLSLGECVKILVTSRVVGQMENMFEDLVAIRQEIVANHEDLDMYLHACVTGLKHFDVSVELSQQVVQKVQEAVKGRFLMAELHMNSLIRYLTAGDLKEALELLPDEIDQTYALAVERIKTSSGLSKDLAMKILMWVTRCRRPLLLGELQHALATKQGRANIGDFLHSPSTITSACAGLVVIENDKVGFVHLTAQEFFNAHQARYFTRPDQKITLTCLNYLLLPCFQDLANRSLTGPCEISGIRQNHPFYDYASINWGFHANTDGVEDTFADTVLSILEKHSVTLHLSLVFILHTIYNDKQEDGLPGGNGTGLFLSLFHEQSSSLSAFISKIPAENIPITRRGVSPYLLAAHLGQTQNIQCMLVQWRSRQLNFPPAASEDGSQRGVSGSALVDFSTPDDNGETPLLAAARQGHKGAVELLLQPNIYRLHPRDDQDSNVPANAVEEDNDSSPISHARVNVNSQNKNGFTALFYAARQGHATVVEALLRNPDIDINLADNESFTTALMIAAETGHSPVIKLLLEHPTVDTNIQDHNGASALSLAAGYGHDSAVRLLLEHPGVDVELSDKDGWTALMAAAKYGHSSVVELLLVRPGVHINTQEKNGQTALMLAAWNGHDAVVQLLLNQPGIAVNTQENNGDTAFFLAARYGHVSAVRLLLQHPDVNVDLPDAEGWTPLMAAAKYARSSVIELLLGRPDVQVNAQKHGGQTALMIAAWAGHDSEVQLLLKYPSTAVNLQTKDGGTALSFAARHGHDSTIRLLLEHPDINVELLDTDGWTSLMTAAQSGHSSVVKLLLERPDVHVNVKENEGQTALMLAGRRGHDSVVQLLLKHPTIDVNVQANNGDTALFIAARYGHDAVVRLFLGHPGIDVDLPDKDGWTALMAAAKYGRSSAVKLLLERPEVNVNAQMTAGQYPLMIAAWGGHRSTIQLLLEHPSINVELSDKDGWTALMSAAKYGHTSVLELLLERSDVQVNMRETDGQTALMIAACSGHVFAVERLLKYSTVDVHLRDNSGKTAIHCAAVAAQEDVTKLLLSHDDTSMDERTDYGCTLLASAIEGGHESLVLWLLELTTVNAKNVSGYNDTPLIFATSTGKQSIAKLLLGQPTIDVNLQDDHGCTALSKACDKHKAPHIDEAKVESEALDLVQLLLTRDDIDINLADDLGHTPLYYAAQSGFLNVVELLESKGGIMHQTNGRSSDNSS